MNYKNGMTYENNYSRAAAYFLSTCAQAPAEEERAKAYDIITGIYKLVAKDPVIMGYKPVEDYALEARVQQKGYEREIKYIRDPITKIDSIISELFSIVEMSTIEDDVMILPIEMNISRALKRSLTSVGVTVSKQKDQFQLAGPIGCFNRLKELAEISRRYMSNMDGGAKGVKSYLYFSRCVFEPSADWNIVAFDDLLGGEGRLILLCSELEKRGYHRMDCFDGRDISLDYIKQHGKKEEPMKLAWAERTHSGISLTYDELRLEPGILWMRIPMFKTILEHMNDIPKNVEDFILSNTKTCDGCHYCIQTDKTNTRPLACININGQNKCPYYVGYTMNWRELSQELATNILDLLEIIDKIID